LRASALLVLAFAQGPAASNEAATPPPTDILSLILHASLVVQFVIVVLLIFSAISWGIVVYKKLQFQKAARQTAIERFDRETICQPAWLKVVDDVRAEP